MDLPVMREHERNCAGQLLFCLFGCYVYRTFADIAACLHQCGCIQLIEPIGMDRHIRKHTSQSLHSWVDGRSQCSELLQQNDRAAPGKQRLFFRLIQGNVPANIFYIPKQYGKRLAIPLLDLPQPGNCLFIPRITNQVIASYPFRGNHFTLTKQTGRKVE